MDENQNYFDRIGETDESPVGRESSGDCFDENMDGCLREGRQIGHRGRRRRRKGSFSSGMIAGLSLALVIFAVMYLIAGIRISEKNKQSAGESVEGETRSVVDSALTNKLKAIEEIIDKYYYLEEVSPDTLEEGIYKGIVEALNDPYSEYYTVEELNDLMEQTQGVYCGIGAYVSIDSDTGLPKISGIIDNSPAQESELRAEDLIYEINGESTNGLTLSEAVSKIKGPEGTDVVLSVVRKGETDYLNITLTRRKVEAPTVDYDISDDGIGYIQIKEFDDVTVDQFADALATVKGKGAKGIIIDLRANPGGSLDAVVEIARMLLPEGMIVYTEDKYGKRKEYTCDGSHKLELPLVVLVDQNSASASEILAGAIKDHQLGTLVGTTTFGKGIVQQIVPFKDGSAVKITISAYYTPSGKNIHGVGIEPDVVCEFNGEAYYGSPEHPDNQLEKAKEYLRTVLQQ